MIHVATVHWRDARWIEPQRRYLDRNLGSPFRVYADLEGVEAPANGGFDNVADLAATRGFADPIASHAEKLNELAAEIGTRAADDDVLLFLDGDAFPIAPLDAFIERTLTRWRLAAVRRDENLGDPQPHPSFCVTTVGFWKEIGGDWNHGFRWRNETGREVTDAGGNLLGRLRELGVDWYPLRRTNRRNLHPVFFAVYDDLVYHHGAGFRNGLCRRERDAIGTVPWPPPDPAPEAGLFERLSWAVRARKWYWMDKRPVVRRERRALGRNRELSQQVYAQLRSDTAFWTHV